jgi:Tfp pilus assembly protein PilE
MIELIVTVAVAAVVVSAVIASGVTMVQFSNGQGRRTAAETTAALALAQIERRMSNAGVNFANARFAVRFRNNVVVGNVPNYNATNASVVARGGAAAGIVEGTDILEVSVAASGVRRPGVTTGTRSGNTVALATGDPLLEPELSAAYVPGGTGPTGQLLLFTDPSVPEDACLARFVPPEPAPTGSPTLNLSFVDDDDAATGGGPACGVLSGTAPPGNGSPCPCRPGFDVYVLEQRHRLVVYQQANGVDMGLYLQDPDPGRAGAFLNTFTPVAVGIENLQISPVVGAFNDGGSLTVEGCTATAITGGGAPNWNVCRCNTGPGQTCVLGDTPIPQEESAFVRSLDIQLTARADRRTGGRLPASFDSVAGPVDGIDRIQATTSVRITNPFLPLQ